ncbi:MAG: LuxR C-terminal-related transcriptional regulator [Gammaproteobacteria bacterium]|nr:LuxR C-terminal-related transcriptional regulator [Gammaproteobacteria bacterium]
MSPAIEHIKVDGRETIILIDYSNQTQSGIYQCIERIADLSTKLKIAFINMSEACELDALIEWPQVKGVFYDHADQDQLLKGVEKIFEGECWFSRKVMTRYMSRHRNTQRRPSQTMSVLTMKERQIIWCMAKGDSNKKIAKRLNISDRTVKTHVYNIFRKINVTNRVQAVNWVKNCREQIDLEVSKVFMGKLSDHSEAKMSL